MIGEKKVYLSDENDLEIIRGAVHSLLMHPNILGDCMSHLHQHYGIMGLSVCPGHLNKDNTFVWSSYLCNKSAVLFHLVVIVMAACQELPHLPTESLGNAAAHQRWQLPGTH